MTGVPWLLLLHQIPPTPPYFRAKVLRRLNQSGALAIKNSAYIIPENDETMEDIQWIRSEIAEEGGEAWLFRTEALAGLSNESLVAAFRKLRADDFKQLLYEMRALRKAMRHDTAEPGKHEPERRKLHRKLEELRRIDFFNAPGREEVETIMEEINRTLETAPRKPAEIPNLKELTSRTWVTRRGVKVDRIATAWLIRRFIDPAARFRFVDPDRYAHSAGEIRFDMFDGEFTHEGELCTFESLLRRTGLPDPALAGIAEMVHDIDLKDDKYQRPETGGIAAMIAGIAALHAEDERRIEDGSRIFEAVYAGLKTARRS